MQVQKYNDTLEKEKKNMIDNHLKLKHINEAGLAQK